MVAEQAKRISGFKLQFFTTRGEMKVMRDAVLVDEDQALRIEVRLGCKPSPCRAAKSSRSCSAARAAFEGHAVAVQAAADGAGPERSAMLGRSRSAGPIRLMSFCAATAARMTPVNASMRCERVSPPCGLASALPTVLTACSQRTALAAEHRTALPRHDGRASRDSGKQSGPKVDGEWPPPACWPPAQPAR